MSATLGGAPLLEARLVMAITGVWTAYAQASADEAPTGRVVLDDGGLQFRGTARTAGVHGNRVRVLVVGGAGGLSTALDAKHYRATLARAVVEDILRETGEALALDSDSAVLATLLPFWTREEGPAGRVLSRLVIDELGANWRTKRDGSVWVGRDSYPEQKVDHVLEAYDPSEKVAVIATDRAELLPGVTFMSQQVRRVAHLIAERSRTEVWFG